MSVQPRPAHRETARRFSFKTFDALKYRDYRLLWFGQVGSGLAQQSEMITRSWLILELTGSPAALGLVHLMRAVGSVAITPAAGVMADRVDRRILLIAANMIDALSFVALAALYMAGQIQVWHVIITATIAGASMTMQNTSKQAIIPSFVPREGLMNAMALQSVVNGSSRVIGPSIAGFMIAWTGVAGSYFITAGLLIIPAVLYSAVKPVLIDKPTNQESFWASFKAGLRFSVHDPTVRVVMLVGVTVITFAMPFLQLMPVYVREVLDAGPETLGLIISVPSVLTILGGLAIASIPDVQRKGALLLLAVMSPAVAAVILSQGDTLWVAVIAMCIFGACSSQYQPATQTAVMKATPDEMRGRVAGFVSMMQNLGAIGVLLYGLVAAPMGIQAAYLIFGITAGSLQLIYFATIKAYRRLS